MVFYLGAVGQQISVATRRIVNGREVWRSSFFFLTNRLGKDPRTSERDRGRGPKQPFHPEESFGALCDEDGKLLVTRTRWMASSRNKEKGERWWRHGGMKERRRKGHGEKGWK